MMPQAYVELSTEALLRERQVLLRRQREFLREWQAADARQKIVDQVLADRGVTPDQTKNFL